MFLLFWPILRFSLRQHGAGIEPELGDIAWLWTACSTLGLLRSMVAKEVLPRRRRLQQLLVFLPPCSRLVRQLHFINLAFLLQF